MSIKAFSITINFYKLIGASPLCWIWQFASLLVYYPQICQTEDSCCCSLIIYLKIYIYTVCISQWLPIYSLLPILFYFFSLINNISIVSFLTINIYCCIKPAPLWLSAIIISIIIVIVITITFSSCKSFLILHAGGIEWN